VSYFQGRAKIEGLEEDSEIPQDSRWPCRDSKRVPLKCLVLSLQLLTRQWSFKC